jgi:thiol-disulfide isomerase/thioredoxin
MRLVPPQCAIACSLVFGVFAAGAEAPPAPQRAAMLRLSNGGFVAGSLVASDQPARMRWQGAAFTAPFDFFTGQVDEIHFPVPAEPPRAAGDTCLELSGGDMLFGTLVSLDDDTLALDVAGAGRVVVTRAHVRTLNRQSGAAALVFMGPTGLADWHAPDPADGWRDESGQLVSDVHGASLRGRFALPARAVIEFELAWKRKPDFVMALGVDGTPRSFERAFRFEVYDDDLVARCAAENQADFARVDAVAEGSGRASVRVYLDQEQGRMVVFSADGQRVADMTLEEKKHEALPGVALVNRQGDSHLRLERLRVMRWGGAPPPSADRDQRRVVRADGTSMPGELVRLDDAAHEFIVRSAGRETRIPVAQLVAATLSPAAPEPPRDVGVVTHDGGRLSGALRRIGDADLTLAVPSLSAPLRVPLAAVRSLLVRDCRGTKPAPADGRTGVLELAGARLPGALVDGVARADASCLVWQPDGSTSASPLRADASGRIVYRETPAPVRVQASRAGPNQPLVLGAMPKTRHVPAPAPASPLALHLVTGDVIPCAVTRIDDKGVWFRSANAREGFVPHAQVKAAELAPLEPNHLRLTRSKRERLLTLPRMQKESPPTHLVQSRNGDYLRGRVIALDGATLRVEVRLELREVPCDRVARIIWLHAGASPEQAEPDRPDAAEAGATRVQAIRHDGVRLTFRAERVADGTIAGVSDVLGPSAVDLALQDQIIIGRAIERRAADLSYQRWKLDDAPEPKYVEADAGSSSGTESELVGKPAPDFTLDLLDGGRFRLADSKGKVVVLDFWATWCGPCLQAMPRVEQAVKAFDAAEVRLVAVNLEETPRAVTALLERQKLDVTVALDRDGVVAGKYQAAAIPQTVVIDRQGNVARLFVGSGPQLGEQLQAAIRAALGGVRGANSEK